MIAPSRLEAQVYTDMQHPRPRTPVLIGHMATTQGPDGNLAQHTLGKNTTPLAQDHIGKDSRDRHHIRTQGRRQSSTKTHLSRRTLEEQRDIMPTIRGTAMDFRRRTR